MWSIVGFAPGHFPHNLKNIAAYEAACAACEVKVRIYTQAQLNTLKNALCYDKRRSGNKGRCLNQHFPAWGLQSGDRLEVTENLRDHADFESLVPHAMFCFGRCQNETLSRRRLPLMSAELGITQDCLIVDMLHCLHLWVLQKYVSFVWWSLILGDAFKAHAPNEEELILLSVNRLRGELFAFYPGYRRENPDHSTLTEVSDLTVQTLGPKGSYLLKTKAAMTRPLVPFTNMLLRKMPGSIPDQNALLLAGESLDRLLRIFRGQSDTINPSALQDHIWTKRLCTYSALCLVCVCVRSVQVHGYCVHILPLPASWLCVLRAGPCILCRPMHFVHILQELHDVVKTFIRLSVRYGIPLTPKAHCLLHLVGRSTS